MLQSERASAEVDFLVDDADAATQAFQSAGGTVLVEPFEIPIGRAAVVADPWGNTFVLLDARRGVLVTDAEKNVVGIKQGSEHAE